MVLVPIGRWDLHLSNTNEERAITFKKYNLSIYELIMAQVQKFDRERPPNSPPITQYTVIYDWEGFMYRSMLSVSLDRRMAQITLIVDKNYPETLANCIYINCSSFISSVLSVLKPVMSSKTFGTIRHFNADRAVWEPVVLELVDASQLPPQYGGIKQG